MDYSFYVKKLGHLDESVRSALLTRALALDKSSTSKNFRKHDGYLVTEAQSLDKSIFSPVTSYLPHCLSNASVLDLEVGVLNPKATLLEHTDNNPPSGKGWLVQRIHKVHVVLQSEGGWCEHRRSASNEKPNRQLLEQGGIYLFNNYVFHSVGNPGECDRVHIVAQYRDEDWTIKKTLYNHLKLTGLQPY